MTTRKPAAGIVGESDRESSQGALRYPGGDPVSGLYRLSTDHKLPLVPQNVRHTLSEEASEEDYPDPDLYEDTAALLLGGRHIREELRLDVDGYFPQMVASGTITRRLSGRIHWIARLHSTGRFSWAGAIWFKDGAISLFPYTQVTVTVSRSMHGYQRRATARFSGGGAPVRVQGFRYESPNFRRVHFEFDRTDALTPVVAIETDAHPNRPAALPTETLGIETVFQRAGFRVSRGGDNPIIAGAGPNALWSDMEMHDAMQVHWSRFADRPQWALWTLFANRHESGSSLGGIMFDDIGPQHRQGTALFYDSFISQAPSGDPQPEAWVNRMRFWTAVHEMGHAFNLAHSWQKSLVFNGNGPWLPLANEPEARSFMNYPYGVSGGQTAFFADFEFRFSDGELLFLRHAPERHVQMGNAEWFDDHGFEQIEGSREPTLQLEVRVNRAEPRFEFLEPVVLELKLKNVGPNPLLLADDLISNTEGLTVIVKKGSEPARSYEPYARYCRKPGQTVLRQGQSQYASLFVAAGRGGWLISEPGVYQVQVCLHRDDEDVLSNPLQLRVAPPSQRAEEVLAQDFFTDEVGRTLAFDGSRYFEQANITLTEIAHRLADRRVARHATIALRMPDLRNVRRLTADDGQKFVILEARRELARRELEPCLTERPQLVAETLGHVDYSEYVRQFTEALRADGGAQATATAATTLQIAATILQERGALRYVVTDLQERVRKIEQATRAA